MIILQRPLQLNQLINLPLLPLLPLIPKNLTICKLRHSQIPLLSSPTHLIMEGFDVLMHLIDYGIFLIETFFVVLCMLILIELVWDRT